MSPWCRVPGIRSLSRLIERRKVDFPHPDGPMIAVTAFRSIANVEVPGATWRAPYQKLKSAHVDRRARRARPAAPTAGRGARVACGVVTNEVLGCMVALIRTSR